MTDFVARRIDAVVPYSGEHALEGIRFRAAGRALGVQAWGMNVLELDPGCERYPEHDHAGDGQEEVYVPLRGSGTLSVGGETVALEPGVLARVGPGEERKVLPGADGLTLLVIGGTPGKAYPS